MVPLGVATGDLTKDAMRLFIALSSWANGASRLAWPSYNTVAADLGWYRRSDGSTDRRRYSKALRQLLDAGLIVKHGTQSHGGSSWTWRYLVAPFPSDAGEGYASHDAGEGHASPTRSASGESSSTPEMSPPAASDAYSGDGSDAGEGYDSDAGPSPALSEEETDQVFETEQHALAPRDAISDHGAQSAFAAAITRDAQLNPDERRALGRPDPETPAAWRDEFLERTGQSEDLRRRRAARTGVTP
jgi:hypothetical protein